MAVPSQSPHDIAVIPKHSWVSCYMVGLVNKHYPTLMARLATWGGSLPPNTSQHANTTKLASHVHCVLAKT